jgi:glucose uptake protein
MSGFIYAAITVLAWGLWLTPSQNVPLRGQQTRTFYVTLTVLLLALVGALVQGLPSFTAAQFWLPFAGGLIWAVSGWSAFVGTSTLGMAKAFGIWAPLNIIVSIAWGMILFGEFLQTGPTNLLLAAGSVAVIVAGILMIVFAGGEPAQAQGGRAPKLWAGYLGTLGAGIGFATYFVPIRISELSMWAAMLPMALGMFAGGTALALLSRSPLRLAARGHYPRLMATGMLWSIGNYGALLMMERIGTGKGFTIAQLCVVVNALAGIFWLRNPPPGSKGAWRMLAGVVLATAAGAVLGNLKS